MEFDPMIHHVDPRVKACRFGFAVADGVKSGFQVCHILGPEFRRSGCLDSVSREDTRLGRDYSQDIFCPL